MSHTKGPWKASQPFYSDELFAIFYQEPGRMRRLDSNGGFREHDARLIAAAPDMYDALKEVLRCFEERDIVDFRPVKKAIAKAEGKE